MLDRVAGRTAVAGGDQDLVHALGTERGLHEVANGNGADEGGLAGAQARIERERQKLRMQTYQASVLALLVRRILTQNRNTT